MASSDNCIIRLKTGGEKVVQAGTKLTETDVKSAILVPMPTWCVLRNGVVGKIAWQGGNTIHALCDGEECELLDAAHILGYVCSSTSN